MYNKNIEFIFSTLPQSSPQKDGDVYALDDNGIEVRNTTPPNPYINKKGLNTMVISKRDLITQTAKQLDDYTIQDVAEIYTALENVALSHLNSANEANPITVKFGHGLSVTSKIKEVDQRPRMWYHAKVSRHYNRVVLNELEK